MNIEYLDSIDSTNSELMRRASRGDYQTVCLVTKAQTAGRGRLGRAWLSDAHALMFSLGVPLAPQDWSGLSLAVGVSVAESLHERIQIKWPNDLWVNGKKLAGILVETTALRSNTGDTASRYVVIGVGINIEAPNLKALGAGRESTMKTPPCGLRDVLPQVTAEAALARILAPLLQTLQHFEHYGWKPYTQRYAARDALLGRSIALYSGEAIAASGQYAGLGAGAELLLQTSNGVQSFISHEVSVCL